MSVTYGTLNIAPMSPYRQISLTYDAAQRALWIFMHPRPRACFTCTLLAELRDCQQRTADQVRLEPGSIEYWILASATPGLFNLGGDLELFTRCIRRGDREALFEYGRCCVDAVYQGAIHLGVPGLTTIALVQGAALGGGLEAALATNVLIAEQGAPMGFPEILFNLFPGMGAYSLIARRLDGARAERVLRDGARYPAEHFHELGLVDELSPCGGGVRTVQNFIRRHRRLRNGHAALDQVRQRVFPLQYQELLDIVSIWADAALHLTSGDLRVMDRLIAAQSRGMRVM